jgi:hypothetical protein
LGGELAVQILTGLENSVALCFPLLDEFIRCSNLFSQARSSIFEVRYDIILVMRIFEARIEGRIPNLDQGS